MDMNEAGLSTNTGMLFNVFLTEKVVTEVDGLWTELQF